MLVVALEDSCQLIDKFKVKLFVIINTANWDIKEFWEKGNKSGGK